MDIECTTFSVSSLQENDCGVETISTSEGATVFIEENSMAEWEHIEHEPGSLSSVVELEKACDNVCANNDDAIFAVPAIPPLKVVPAVPPDEELFDLVQQMCCSSTADPSTESTEEIPVIPEYLCDRITHEIFQDPVVTPGGITYERKNIEEHLNTVGNFDPITHVRLTTEDIYPDHRIRIALDEFTSMNPEAAPSSLDDVDNNDANNKSEELQRMDQQTSAVLLSPMSAVVTEFEGSTEINTTTV